MKKFIHVIFTSGEWKYYHRREFAKAIGKNYEPWSYAVAVQYPVSLLLNIFFKFKQRLLPFLKGEEKPKKISENLILFTPFILFHYKLWAKSKFFAYIDSYLLSIQLKRFIKLNFGSDLKIFVWTYIPQQIDLLKFIKYDYIIYDMYDDNEKNYDGSKNDKMVALNRRLVSNSILTLCNAHSVIDTISKYSDNAIFVPSAINIDFYKNSESSLETSLDKVDTKIIGYLGNIRDWIDFTLLEEILNYFKNFKVVLLGGVERNVVDILENLKKHDNLIHINHVQQNLTPNYVKKFSVGIIPFKINEFTKSVLPYKFYEYIASEIPIVTTALPELEIYTKVCGFSKNNNEFLENIKAYLDNEKKVNTIEYSKIIFENTWTNRTDKIYAELRKKLNLE